jgi:hypothetical protein
MAGRRSRSGHLERIPKDRLSAIRKICSSLDSGDAFVEALQRVIDDSAMRDLLRTHAATALRQHFDWQMIVRAFISPR